MAQYNIYKDIAERTGGNIYIGVIGGVRTGKSTFIKRFMDMLVLDNIEDEYVRNKNKRRTSSKCIRKNNNDNRA